MMSFHPLKHLFSRREREKLLKYEAKIEELTSINNKVGLQRLTDIGIAWKKNIENIDQYPIFSMTIVFGYLFGLRNINHLN